VAIGGSVTFGNDDEELGLEPGDGIGESLGDNTGAGKGGDVWSAIGDIVGDVVFARPFPDPLENTVRLEEFPGTPKANNIATITATMVARQQRGNITYRAFSPNDFFLSDKEKNVEESWLLCSSSDEPASSETGT
jgi:hypothetical protein